MTKKFNTKKGIVKLVKKVLYVSSTFSGADLKRLSTQLKTV